MRVAPHRPCDFGFARGWGRDQRGPGKLGLPRQERSQIGGQEEIDRQEVGFVPVHELVDDRA